MIGTAGHVDHGKTTLLRALAGGSLPDADRLPEERARGLTIDIGYAELVLEPGRTVGVMDVPGHERFVRNMVAAASGIDLVLLVVAADDGVMPQTREHLEIADLLGAATGVVALTKIDLVDADLALLAEEDVRELLAGTFLEGAPIVPVSGETGEGVEELRRILLSRLRGARPRPTEGIFRLPVQRSFTRPGHGTVVTGVPLSGRVRVGDVLEVIPGGERARVRAIQAYHHEVEEGRAGHRTALKLSDVSWKEVRRGHVIAEPGYLEEAHLLEARFRHLPRRGRPVLSNQPVRFHTGTAEVLGRIFLLTDREVPPGGEALVQFRLDRPVITAPGDRFVVRSPSPQVTLGGGYVIGISSRKISAGRVRLVRRVAEREEGVFDLERAVRHEVRHAGLEGISGRSLCRIVVRRPDEVRPVLERLLKDGSISRVGERFLGREAVEQGRARLREVLRRFHEREPLRSAADHAYVRDRLGVSEMVLDHLVAGEPGVESARDGRLREAGYSPALTAGQRERLAELERRIREGGLATPKEGELPALIGASPDETTKLLDLLVEEGKVERIGSGVVFHRESVERVKEEIAAWIREHGPMAPADLKNLLGMTRKYSIPLFEWLDTIRFTVRRGDRRELP